MAWEDEHHERGPTPTADRPTASDVDNDRPIELNRPTGAVPDPWFELRRFTSARIALGRTGGSLPTAELLSFSLDHAAARDAVYSELDVARLQQELAPLGLPTLTLATQAPDRQTYLQRPDLGRTLSAESRLQIEKLPSTGKCDVNIVVADGLSSLAAQSHAPAVLASVVSGLRTRGLSIAPLTFVHFGRVGVMDAIGAAFNSRVGLILIGERPGLGAADSLGAYLVFAPSAGKTDADRNCVSNIRPGGLPPHEAANTILYLIEQMMLKQTSGVKLKDERVLSARIDAPQSASRAG